MSRAELLLITLALSSVPDLYAQQPIDTILSGLKPTQTLRVRIRELEGQSRFLSIRADSLALWLADSRSPFNPSTIDSLWVKGRATGAGAIVGGLVAGAVSFGIWAAFCEGLSEGTGCDEWGTVAGLSLAGAAGGALLGAAVGTAVPKWRLRYARRIPVQGGVRIQPALEVAISIRH